MRWIVIMLLWMADRKCEMFRLGNEPKKWNVQNSMYQTKLTCTKLWVTIYMQSPTCFMTSWVPSSGHSRSPKTCTRLWIHCVHIWCMWVSFATQNYASCTLHTILKLSMPKRQEWHTVLRTSRIPGGGIQEVSKQAKDCILCSHFSACKFGLTNWNIQSKAGIHLVRQRW